MHPGSARPAPAPAVRRRRLRVSGIVQGVGFRPFVHRLAARHALAGWVRNERGVVAIELEGPPAALAAFEAALGREAPAAARIDAIASEDVAATGAAGFRIAPSDPDGAAAEVAIAPDLATCDDCVRELLDPAGRRHGYPLLTCTACGPRLTILRGAPYDRERTTMAAFPMCEACRAEYDDPRDRRFHAEPIACPACGPRLDAPIEAVAAALLAGRIAAIKGVGGYHLACDARRPETVAELRRRKHRAAKPFALLVADVAAARALAEVSPAEEELLRSPARPIVLLRRRPDAGVADAVAPGTSTLGIMLPPSALHVLLAHAVDRAPLVLTSGNLADEPIAFEDDDARRRLGAVADLFLGHDRAIAIRCDDSVARVVAGRPQVLRRARGLAPRPLALPAALARPTVALGGHLKAAFAIGQGRRAVLGHHVGDLDDRRALDAYERALDAYLALLGAAPARVVHDLHPDYASTRLAIALAGARGLERLAVGHHHAHLASCLAEHGVAGPAIGVAFDGLGYGPDGTLWGGEFLVGGLAAVERAAHLRPVAMPGGDQAIREPWRMALAHLLDGGHPVELEVAPAALRTVARMIERGVHAPPTSSVGRLFDAVAALLGGPARVAYEGQAAIELEALAERGPADAAPYPYELGARELDPRPLVGAVLADRRRGVAPATIARRFHATLADAIAAVCARLRDATGVARVALTGGVFQNRLLTEDARRRLVARGFEVLCHGEAPPNDGGLALGQLAVAAARDEAPCA